MSAASDLINYLVGVANSAIANFNSAAFALRFAPATGVIINTQPTKQATQTFSPIAIPVIPAAPANMVIDVSAMDTSLTSLVNSLSGSWMKRYLPDNLNDTALSNLLNGRIDLDDIDEIEDDLRAALLAATNTLRTGLESAITAHKNNLDDNIDDLQPRIDAALTRAGDDSAHIAWARARDQAAREALRQENEAISDWASRGWAMPSGVLTAQAAVARQAALASSSSMAAEQAIQLSKNYLDIAKMSIDNWLKAAQLQMESEISAYKTAEEARMKTAAMEMENYRERAKLAFQGLGLQVDLQKFAGQVSMQYRLGVNNAIHGLMNAYADMAKTGADNRNKVAESHRAVLAAMSDYWRAAVASADVTQKGKLEDKNLEQQWSQTAAKIIVDSARNYVEAAKASADIYAKVAGMAVGGLNGIASISSEE